MADVTGLLDQIRARAGELRDGAMDAVEQELRDQADRGKTGRMRDEVKVAPFETADTVGCEALSPTDYAEYVDQGTPAHEIRPRNAKALRFEVGGTVVYAKVVRHPGYAPTVHWFSDTVARWPEYLRAAQ